MTERKNTLSTLAEKSAQRRILPTKTVLSLSALAYTNFGGSPIVYAPIRYVQLTPKILSLRHVFALTF